MRPREALNAQMGKPRHREALLSSPLPLCPLKKNEMKVDNQYSIRPWLSEEGKPFRVTHFKALAQLGLGNHTGAYAKPHSSSTSTGTVLESLHPGGE